MLGCKKVVDVAVVVRLLGCRVVCCPGVVDNELDRFQSASKELGSGLVG